MTKLTKISKATFATGENIEVHFENIKATLIEYIEAAKKSVYVAVAWFNDKELYEKLKTKVENDEIYVNIIVSGKPIKSDKLSELDFTFFQEHELCKYYCMPTECNEFLHHKFCVIDESILITGSYNWTYAASNLNLENIIVLKSEEIASLYVKEFKRIAYVFIEKPIEDYIEYIKNEYERLGTNLEMFFQTLKQVGNVEMTIQRLKIPYKLSNFLPVAYQSTGSLHNGAEYYLNSKDSRAEWWEGLDLQWKLFFNKSEMNRSNCSEKISDVAIEAIFKKTNLDCSSSNLTSLDGIVELTSLTSLNCGGNQIESLAPLKLLANLAVLYCSSNKLKSIDFDNDVLYYLDCSDNPIAELPKNAEFRSLIKLVCTDTYISDFNVDGFRSIKQLYFGATNVDNLQSITKFQSITHIGCSNNGIEDIKPLAELLQLVYLDASNNSLTYLYGLEKLVSLTHLLIQGNNIQSLSELDHLPMLTYLKITNRATSYLQDNEISGDKLTTFKNQRFDNKKAWNYERREYDTKRNAHVVKESYTLKI